MKRSRALHSSLLSREAGQRLGRLVSLADQVAGVGAEISMAVHVAGGPDDLDQVDPVGVSQAEVEPRVGGRLVAAAAEAMGHAAPAPGDDGNLRPHGVAVRAAALEARASGTGRLRFGCASRPRAGCATGSAHPDRPSLSRSPTASPRPIRGTCHGAPARSETSVRRPSPPPSRSCAGIW